MNVIFSAHRTATLLCILGLSAPLVSCGRSETPTGDERASESAVESSLTVPFKLKVDQAGALYTYVEEDGSFHIAQKLADIPEAARQQVRVVIDGQPPGSPSHVFVADLTQARVGETVAPVAITRSQWEERGLKLRKAKVVPLEQQANEQPAAGNATAVIYGADWCGPCHQAEAYMKKHGVPYVKKDIEKDPSAQQEMRAKLRSAGLGGSSIPILDVAGTILVGFSPRAIDAALRRAR